MVKACGKDAEDEFRESANRNDGTIACRDGVDVKASHGVDEHAWYVESLYKTT